MLSSQVLRSINVLGLPAFAVPFGNEAGTKMSFTYYLAVDSDGIVSTCIHQHQTVASAVACITWAGGYVVGVEDGIMRALTDAEEAEFQSAMYGRASVSILDPASVYWLEHLLRSRR